MKKFSLKKEDSFPNSPPTLATRLVYDNIKKDVYCVAVVL